MKTSDLYTSKSECCGCELCSQSCPKDIIQMEADEVGFLYPKIEDNSTCINCKKCLSVCPMKSPGRKGLDITKSYSFSLKDERDLRKSASGGLATAISRTFIQAGGIVYGVRYSDNFMTIKYDRATEVEELEYFRGSKYSQASKEGIYAKIKEDLKNNKKVLFIGLPCETSAIYHAFKSNTDILYTISLICHGPTSQKVHQDFCKSIELSNSSHLINYSVRYKDCGWKPYYIHGEYENGETYHAPFAKTDYGTAFLYLKRPSCRVCKYKYGDKQFGLQADLTIGDFHGVDDKSIQYNKWGVSQGSVHTEKGKWLMNLVQSDDKKFEIPFSTIKITNRGLFMAIPQRGKLNVFINDYVKNSLHAACNSTMVMKANKRERIKNKVLRFLSPNRIFSKINRIIHKR